MAEGSELAHVPGNDRTPSCNISSSSRFNNEDASVELSNVLNVLGYGHELRQKRRECYRAHDNDINAPSGFVQAPSGLVQKHQRITVGSKAEGLSRIFESDRDVLFVTNRVECIEVGFDLNLIPKDKTVFRMGTHICYPGHWILVLERGVPLFCPVLLVALRETLNGKVILSSDAVLNNRIMGSQFVPGPIFSERAGPSLPVNAGQFKADTVQALRCHCPSILQRWAARSRHWPPSNVVEKVVSMGAFLTPVGFTGSRNKDIEWRICFNTGETELMINLNDTQIKVYVLLKMIAKDVLKPRHKEITSFLLKNIILWLAENNPQSKFHERSLFFLLRASLLELITALSNKQVRYYMIPERNLMAACDLTDAQTRTWLATLTDMIDEGPMIIRRLSQIRQAIISNPEPLQWYNTRRIELELILLEFLKHDKYIVGPQSGNSIDRCLLGYAIYTCEHPLLHGLLLRHLPIVNEVFEKVCTEENRDRSSISEYFNIFQRLLM